MAEGDDAKTDLAKALAGLKKEAKKQEQKEKGYCTHSGRLRKEVEACVIRESRKEQKRLLERRMMKRDDCGGRQ